MKKKLCALLLALLCLAGCGGSGSKNWTPAPKSSEIGRASCRERV